jgi:hypothetical protein
MEPIIMEPTAKTPTIEFFPDGKLRIEGRSIPENPLSLYDPLVEFVQNLNQVSVLLDVNLEYFNTASAKKLLELFKTIDANNKVDNVLINWHYEYGDDDSMEMAEFYEERLLRTEFRYCPYEEAIE